MNNEAYSVIGLYGNIYMVLSIMGPLLLLGCSMVASSCPALPRVGLFVRQRIYEKQKMNG